MVSSFVIMPFHWAFILQMLPVERTLFLERQHKWCSSLLSTGSGVFSGFQLTLMTARFDSLESIIGWFVVCGSKIESELLHDSIKLSILMSPQLARAHTRPLFSLILCALLDQTSIIAELNQAAWTLTHLSRPTRRRPTCTRKMILIKGWDVTEATLRNKH
ncbi:hypothetical protein B0H14DRAFT_3865943 [Mycena olivaceomarginata]|nr:hypothetical protein B0H14DRAFT_3865943 [Mycena olivaceomarginata]